MKTMNYKSCPLKKRPIKYVEEEEPETFIPAKRAINCVQEEQEHCIPIFPEVQSEALPLLKKCFNPDEPEDLTVKRNIQEASFPDNHQQIIPKRCCLGWHCPYRNKSSSSTMGACTEESRGYSLIPPTQHYSPCQTNELRECSTNNYCDYSSSALPETNLAVTKSGLADSFRSAFVAASACSNLSAFWPPQSNVMNADMLTPPSSVSSSDNQEYSLPNCSNIGSWPQITPPSSPIVEENMLPQDLSICSDIPLPALYHFTESDKQKREQIFSNNCEQFANSNRKGEKCQNCSKVYYTRGGLLKHQQFYCRNSDLDIPRKIYTCAVCGKVYNTIGALKMHERTHTLPCKCPICGKAFSRPWLLQGHIRTHTGEKPFHCTLCNRSFADRSNLRAHQQTHVDVKKYSCPKCTKSFSRMSLLNKHYDNKCCI